VQKTRTKKSHASVPLRGQSRQILNCTLGPENQIRTFSTTACGFLIFEMRSSWDI
jgi:hypothetical protein